MLRDGVKTVILGAPNAGKSSLLNRLIGKERALVSPEPGTTRDFLEERVIVGPHCLRLIDTAGFNPTPVGIERLGIEKTLERSREADLFLVVLDASDPTPPPFPAELHSRLQVSPVIVVVNKIDLAPAPASCFSVPGARQVEVSALTGVGLDELEAQIVKLADGARQDPDDHVAVNARHAQALSEARAALDAARTKLMTNEPAELLASDLQSALGALGEITGRIDHERMLDRLFATFCIGK
jgi:tRNA modification GTPase